MHHEGFIYAFIASLDTTGDNPQMVYNINCDNQPLQAFKEVPATVLAAYGTFIGCVEDWVNGGELHESLRHDD